MSAGDSQEAFGIREAAKTQLGDGAAVPRGGEHVLQHLPRAIVIMHVVGRDERNARRLRRLDQASHMRAIFGPAMQLGQQITAIAEEVSITRQRGSAARTAVAINDAADEPLGMFGDVDKCEQARAFFRLTPAAGDQSRQTTVSVAIGCQEHDRRERRRE